MTYLIEMTSIAEQFGKCLSVQYQASKSLFLVKIDNVVHKVEHVRRSLLGQGTTLEDACYDYVRKCHGSDLENYVTNQVVHIK